MIDTHCHLDFPQLLVDLPAVLHRAREAGITQFIIPGTTVEDSIVASKLSDEHQSVFGCAGIHPGHVDEYGEEERARLTALLTEAKRVVAIGEVGLDYFRLDPKDVVTRHSQGALFSEMIALARQHALPLILHTRDCFAAAHAQLAAEGKGVPAVVHCFTGTVEEARQWLDLGCHISFTGILTYKKNESLREVAAYVPMERVMLETDAPYLAPQGFRGQVCEPKYVRNVAECLAAVRGISFEKVEKVTTATARSFFAI